MFLLWWLHITWTLFFTGVTRNKCDVRIDVFWNHCDTLRIWGLSESFLIYLKRLPFIVNKVMNDLLSLISLCSLWNLCIFMKSNAFLISFMAHIDWKSKYDGNNPLNFTAGLLRSCGNKLIVQENGASLVVLFWIIFFSFLFLEWHKYFSEFLEALFSWS